MPHSSSAFLAFVSAILLVAGCGSSEVSNAIAQQLAKTKDRSVDLGLVVQGNWDRVCFLGPYSDNQVAQRTLGFEWDVESRTSIRMNEGVSLLLFVSGDEVTNYVEHPRAMGDFSNLTAQCFPRSSTQFHYDLHPKKGWPGLFPAHAA